MRKELEFEINTLRDVWAWFEACHRAKMLFHPDELVENLRNGKGAARFTREEANAADLQMGRACDVVGHPFALELWRCYQAAAQVSAEFGKKWQCTVIEHPENGHPVLAFLDRQTKLYVFDPGSSPCRRFAVDPEQHYGIPAALAERLLEANRRHAGTWEDAF